MVKKQILSIFILFLLVANPAFADELPVEQSYGHLYSLIVSSGNRPDDMDVIVVKNTVREFTQFLTYKHCSSHDANGTPNMISKLRFMRLLKTEEFQSEPQRQDLFKKIFESPSCKFIEKNLNNLKYPTPNPG